MPITNAQRNVATWRQRYAADGYPILRNLLDEHTMNLVRHTVATALNRYGLFRTDAAHRAAARNRKPAEDVLVPNGQVLGGDIFAWRDGDLPARLGTSLQSHSWPSWTFPRDESFAPPWPPACYQGCPIRPKRTRRFVLTGACQNHITQIFRKWTRNHKKSQLTTFMTRPFLTPYVFLKAFVLPNPFDSCRPPSKTILFTLRHVRPKPKLALDPSVLQNPYLDFRGLLCQT